MSGSERDPPPGRARRPVTERAAPTARVAGGSPTPQSPAGSRPAAPATPQGVPLRGAVLRSAAPVIPPTAPAIDDLLADPTPARGASRPRTPSSRAPDPADDPWAEHTPAAPPPEAARAWTSAPPPEAGRARTSGSPGWAGLVDLDDAHGHAAPAPPATRADPVAVPVPPSRSTPDLRAAPDARAGIPRGLELPLPVGAPSAPSRAALVDGLTLEPAAAPHPLDDLAAGSGSAPRGPAAPRGHGLREYREVIGIGLVTIVAAGAAVVYLRGPAPRDDRPTVTPPVARVAPSAAPTEAPPAAATTGTTAPATAGAAAEPAASVEPTAPRRAAVPLLSVLSDPPGAEVVVDGEVLGKTPLILPAPNVPLLVLTLRLEGYVDWVGQVKPSAAGHMSLSPTLRKR